MKICAYGALKARYQPTNPTFSFMIHIPFPFIQDQRKNFLRDQAIFKWIYELHYEVNDQTLITYNAGSTPELVFKREEDAIMFRLKFNL